MELSGYSHNYSYNNISLQKNQYCRYYVSVKKENIRLELLRIYDKIFIIISLLGGFAVNFSQIKCFLAASECLSFTKAAERLYLSQPVLSRQIAAMEDELGMELFVREKKSVRLTPAGEVMADGLSELAQSYQILVNKAEALHKGFAGNLSIGLVEGQLICPPYSVGLTKFHDRYPDVHVNLSNHSLAGLKKALEDGDIDIGFASNDNFADMPDLESIVVGSAQIFLVVPKSHPLANVDNLTLEDFKDDTFLTLPAEESPVINRSIGRWGKVRTLEAPNIGALALWLEAGYGIFPLNGNHSLRNNPNLVFKNIPGLGSSTEIIAWKASNKNPLIKMFIEQFPKN